MPNTFIGTVNEKAPNEGAFYGDNRVLYNRRIGTRLGEVSLVQDYLELLSEANAFYEKIRVFHSFYRLI